MRNCAFPFAATSIRALSTTSAETSIPVPSADNWYGMAAAANSCETCCTSLPSSPENSVFQSGRCANHAIPAHTAAITQTVASSHVRLAGGIAITRRRNAEIMAIAFCAGSEPGIPIPGVAVRSIPVACTVSAISIPLSRIC